MITQYPTGFLPEYCVSSVELRQLLQHISCVTRSFDVETLPDTSLAKPPMNCVPGLGPAVEQAAAGQVRGDVQVLRETTENGRP